MFGIRWWALDVPKQTEQLGFVIPSTFVIRASSFSKRIVTRFLQDFLYFTEASMRQIAALSSA